MEDVLVGILLVGPDGRGSYRYGLKTAEGRLFISAHPYHNVASAHFDGARTQRVTESGELVPDSRYSPGVN